MAKMKICTRCSKDIGISKGLLDSVMHMFGGGLCNECKREERKREHDLKMIRQEEYAREQGRIDARRDNRPIDLG